MDIIIKINGQTAGRDKLARLLQYLSRFLWHRLQQRHKEGVGNIKNIEYQLSLFRKFLRFGRFFESLYTTLPVFKEEESAIRYTIILSKIANALFLLADHILLLGRVDFCTVDTEKWARISNKYWLYSITMNLARDFYEIFQILKSEKANILPNKSICSINDFIGILTKSFMIIQANQSIMIDTLKNTCDFFIPLTALGHLKLSPGMIGALGVVSSLAGLLVLVEPNRKLTP